MRLLRSLSWMSVLAGVATYYMTRKAKRRNDQRRQTEIDERTRWETDGGATAAGPQPPGATF